MDFLQKKNQARRDKNTFRQLVLPAGELTDFTSNDYLGVAGAAEVRSLFIEKLQVQSERRMGSGGSRLLSGNYYRLEQLEKKLEQWFDADAGLLFNSGYAANSGLLAAVCDQHSVIFYDSESHASIKDGARISQGRCFSFRHNNLNDLEAKLRRVDARGQRFIVAESLYSMSGSFADLTGLVYLAEKYQACLVIDEAHTTGLYSDGRGLVSEQGLADKVFARVFTFGKALGSMGAMVAGSPALKEFLVNHARPFIYSTCMPTYQVEHLFSVLEYLEKKQAELFHELAGKVALFSVEKGLVTPIQPVFVEGVDRVREKAIELQRAGFDVRPIVSPTVPAGKERLRVIIHSFNQNEDIKKLREYCYG